MQCPIDGTTLAISDKQGIEIDYCPKCRGVWLDRGELEKLIERSENHGDYSRNSQERGYDQDRHDFERRDHDEYKHDSHHHKHKKKEGFLGDLFDF